MNSALRRYVHRKAQAQTSQARLPHRTPRFFSACPTSIPISASTVMRSRPHMAALESNDTKPQVRDVNHKWLTNLL